MVGHRRQTGVGELALREETVAKEIDKVCLTPKCCTEGVSSQFGRHVEKLDVGDGRASVFPYFVAVVPIRFISILCTVPSCGLIV